MKKRAGMRTELRLRERWVARTRKEGKKERLSTSFSRWMERKPNKKKPTGEKHTKRKMTNMPKSPKPKYQKLKPKKRREKLYLKDL